MPEWKALRRAGPSRTTIVRVAALVGAIALISVLRYGTGPPLNLLHELTLRLYYVPILVGAYWFGPIGGLAIACVSSILYVRHLRYGAPAYDASRYAEVMVFYVIGLSV